VSFSLLYWLELLLFILTSKQCEDMRRHTNPATIIWVQSRRSKLLSCGTDCGPGIGTICGV